MNSKRVKRVLCGALGIVTALMMAMPAFACGGRGSGGYRGGYSGTRYTARRDSGLLATACPVEGCTIAGRHYHNGVLYCGTYHADGYCTTDCFSQGYGLAVPACPVEGCTIAGRHLHDGVTYCGTYHADGNCVPACFTSSYQTVAACPVEGCTIPGRHYHNGVTYCGTYHEDGYCLSDCYGSCYGGYGCDGYGCGGYCYGGYGYGSDGRYSQNNTGYYGRNSDRGWGRC